MSDITQITPEVFNNALSKSIQAMACGPDCQKQRKIQELKQKYLAARQNAKTAPKQLQQAKDAYILADKGQRGYTAYKTTESEITLAKDKQKITDRFQANMDNASKQVDVYKTLYTNYHNIYDLFTSYTTKNIKLDEMDEKINAINVTSDRKIHYSLKSVDSLEYWSWYLKRIYIILLFILFYMMMMNSTLTKYSKFFILIFFILFPLIQIVIIPRIVKWIYLNTFLIQNRQL